jgi:hypothetical protein
MTCTAYRSSSISRTEKFWRLWGMNMKNGADKECIQWKSLFELHTLKTEEMGE